MTDNEEEQIYSIALTMVPGIGHIGAKRLVEGMKSATDVFRYRKELSERIPGLTNGYLPHWIVRHSLPVQSRNSDFCRRTAFNA